MIFVRNVLPITFIILFLFAPCSQSVTINEFPAIKEGAWYHWYITLTSKSGGFSVSLEGWYNITILNITKVDSYYNVTINESQNLFMEINRTSFFYVYPDEEFPVVPSFLGLQVWIYFINVVKFTVNGSQPNATITYTYYSNPRSAKKFEFNGTQQTESETTTYRIVMIYDSELGVLLEYNMYATMESSEGTTTLNETITLNDTNQISKTKPSSPSPPMDVTWIAVGAIGIIVLAVIAVLLLRRRKI